jgi:hypothetical protein
MNENENYYKLTFYDKQLNFILQTINRYNVTGSIGARPIKILSNLFKSLGILKDSIILVKDQEHAINNGLVSANEKKADELINKYVEIRYLIDNTLVKKYPRPPRRTSGGQRSKIKKRRFKSNKTNKSKGRKRPSRRRRISRKRSKKC